MDKLADGRYVNSDVFCDRDCIQKGNDCNRLQRNVSQDVYVPMDGDNCSNKLANGTYVNDDVFCHPCHVQNDNDCKRFQKHLSEDTYVPIEVGYNFVSRLANKTYENGDAFSYIYHLQKDNDCRGLQKNLSQGEYVPMDSIINCRNENSVKNTPQMLPPLVSTDTDEPSEYITINNNIYQKEIVKKIKSYSKREENQAKINKATNKKQLRPLSEGFNEIPPLKSDLRGTKKCYSEYDVPNSPRPKLPLRTQRNGEPVFRSRSNACVSQNRRTYLKETKSADV